MRSTIGIICLVAGVAMLVWAYRESETLKGQMHRLFSSSTNNRITWMYVGGAVLCTAGVFQIYAGGKK
jgi:hypothetical protein